MALWQHLIISMVVLLTNVAFADMTDVSCVYETTELEIQKSENHSHHDKKGETSVKWYFWRTNKTVEVANSEQSFGEKWTISDKNRIFYQALYHDKKFLLDFQPADLVILGKKTSWDVRSTLFPKSLLMQLEQKETSQFNDYDKVRYEGKVAGIGYKVDWLPELNLPVRIEKGSANSKIIIEMKEIYPLGKTPYKQQSTEHYDDLDYADIGDNESHPVVAQLQKNSGIGYFHQH